jgi:hypothetical protein
VALAAAALEHRRHDQDRSGSWSSDDDHMHLRSHSPRRASSQNSDDSDRSASSRSSMYSTASDEDHTLVATSRREEGDHPPPATSVPPSDHTQLLDDNIPPVPVTQGRRNGALGTAAPGTAASSYLNRPAVSSPLSSEVRPDDEDDDQSYTPRGGFPANRSPRRDRRSPSYDAIPLPHQLSDSDTLGGEYFFPPVTTATATAAGGGGGGGGGNPVGANRYPHMGVRRQSGGDVEPQATAPPAVLPPAHKGAGADGSWRMSRGMPRGWQRDSGVGWSDRPQGRRLRASDFAAGQTAEMASYRGGAGGVGYGQAL